MNPILAKTIAYLVASITFSSFVNILHTLIGIMNRKIQGMALIMKSMKTDYSAYNFAFLILPLPMFLPTKVQATEPIPNGIEYIVVITLIIIT